MGRNKFQKFLVGLVPAADALVGSGALGLCCAGSTLLPVLEATVFVTLHKRGSLFPLTSYKLEGGAQSTSGLCLTKLQLSACLPTLQLWPSPALICGLLLMSPNVPRGFFYLGDYEAVAPGTV